MCGAWCLSLNGESSLNYWQQLGKIDTNRQLHLTSGMILCCFSQLLQRCPPAGAGSGWGGSSPVQPDLIELGLWRENLLWMFLLIRNPTCRATQRSGRVVRAEYLTQQDQFYIWKSLSGQGCTIACFLSSSTTPPFIAQVQTTYIIKHLNPEQ